jgi:hypothetical protein
MDREPTIPHDVAPRTSDLTFVQVLAETRNLAQRRADEEGEHGDERWAAIADRADRVLGHVGVERDEVGHTPAIGMDRIDRPTIELDAGEKDQLAATLRALDDRADGPQLDAAARTLADLEDRLS